jgi:uroporphyrinogen decarboxylase
MNAHERLWKALSHEEADRVPTFTQTIEPPFIQRFDSINHISKLKKVFAKHWDLHVAKMLGYDSKWYHTGHVNLPPRKRPNIPIELQKYVINRRVSSAGTIHEKNSQGGSWYVNGILKTPELIKEWIEFLKQGTIGTEGQYQYFENIWKEWLAKDFVAIPTAGGPFYTVWSSIGMDRFGYISRKYPELVKELMEIWTNLTIQDHTKYFERGIDMMFICDDQAFKDSHMISPKQCEEFIFPYYKQMADNAHKYNAKFLVHTDGFMEEAIPGLIEAGVDAIEPLEYEAGNRLDRLKANYGDKITFIGNVAASDILCFASIEQTIQATKQCLLDAAEGGGLILSAGANILADAKVENVCAMVETVKKFGAYPLNKANLK